MTTQSDSLQLVMTDTQFTNLGKSQTIAEFVKDDDDDDGDKDNNGKALTKIGHMVTSAQEVSQNRVDSLSESAEQKLTGLIKDGATMCSAAGDIISVSKSPVEGAAGDERISVKKVPSSDDEVVFLKKEEKQGEYLTQIQYRD